MVSVSEIGYEGKIKAAIDDRDEDTLIKIITSNPEKTNNPIDDVQ